MKRSEKQVLIAVMNSPCTYAQLLYLLRLPAFKIKQAVDSLVQSGNLQFDGVKYHIKKRGAV